MKQLRLKMNKAFEISAVFKSQMFEFEKNATEIYIDTPVDEYMAYEIHIEKGDYKRYGVMDKLDDGLHYIVDSGFFNGVGEYTLQVKGAIEGKDIISDPVKVSIQRFINAKDEPTPEQQSEFEKLIIKVEGIDADVKALDREMFETAQRLENMASDIEDNKDAIDKLESDLNDTTEATESNTRAIIDLHSDIAELDNTKANVSFVQGISDELTNEIESVEAILPDKADKDIVNAQLNLKLNTSDAQAMQTNLTEKINKKQDKLIAGDNISIDGNVISATGGGGGSGDVTKAYLRENYYDKPFFNDKDTLVIKDDGEELSLIEERDISYSNIPMYCGKWVDGKDMHRRVYVVNSGIAKGNTIKVADKPANMSLLVRGFGIVEGTASATKHTMTNSDVSVYVNNDGVYAINNFTGYAERLYVVLEYTVTGGSV